MQIVQGLFRTIVVAFTVLTLLVVAAVGVSASSGKLGSSNALKNSVVAVFSGHFDQTGFHEGTTTNGDHNNNGNKGGTCKPPKKAHKHATPDRENPGCDTGDDSGSG
jgi:hypothetical protein